jgi:putative ABC transport system permease protein
MRFLHYIVRNIRRNPVRSLLTVASTTVTLFLTMILLAFGSINVEVAESTRIHNRVIVMNSRGFAGRVPIALTRQIDAMNGVVATTPFNWFGGKFGEESLPFAQFAVDADTVFRIYDEFSVPPDQLEAFRRDRAGCVVGRRLAEDRGFKVGDPLPLKGDLFPVDLKLTIRGVYDGPPNRDRRICFLHWDYVDESLKQSTQPQRSGNSGLIVVKCKNSDVMARVCRNLDAEMINSDTPTRTQTEEAFGKMFGEMMRDLQWLIPVIGMTVVVALLFVAGNSMAMTMRERTTEIAILKAIGYTRPLILTLVLAEAVLVAGFGGLVGSFGCKLLCDVVDVTRYSAGMLPYFFVPWKIAVGGLVASLFVGLLSGILPAVSASRLSVIQGLRKVV